MVFTRRLCVGSPFPVTDVVQQVRQWAVCACVCVCGCSGEVFFPPTTVCTSPFYLCRSWEQKKKKTAAVVDFFSPRLNFKDVEAPRRAVCNECRFFLSELFYLFQNKKKKRSHFIWNYCDHWFCFVLFVFYKSTHCSLMLTTFCLGVNAAVCQGSGTC